MAVVACGGSAGVGFSDLMMSSALYDRVASIVPLFDVV